MLRDRGVCRMCNSMGCFSGRRPGVYEFLKRHHLPPTRGRWHDDQRIDTGLIPGFDALADFRSATVERHLLQPAVGHECKDFSVFLVGDSLSDSMHLLLKTRFDPVVLVVW